MITEFVIFKVSLGFMIIFFFLFCMLVDKTLTIDKTQRRTRDFGSRMMGDYYNLSDFPRVFQRPEMFTKLQVTNIVERHLEKQYEQTGELE